MGDNMENFESLRYNVQFKYFNRTEDKIDIVEKNISHKIMEILSILEKKDKILFRGFSCKNINSNFWEWIFEVGEKGASFRKNMKISTEEKSVNYFSNHNITAKENYENLLSDIQKEIMPKYIQKYEHLLVDYEKLEKRLNEYRELNKIDYKDMYYLLLLWLHNIGNDTGYKHDSPLISTTTSMEVAFKFANNNKNNNKNNNNKNNNKDYIFVILECENGICDFFETERLNNILKEINVKWHENKNKEVMFKDAIFPQCIIGILEKCEENYEEHYNFILNPALIDIINNFENFTVSNEEVATILLYLGISVNQDRFEEGFQSLGYDKWTNQIGDNRKIITNDESFDVTTINNILNDSNNKN